MVAAIGHELVELGLVLGEAQFVQEALELALLLFEAAQSLLAVFVEGGVAAAGLLAPAPATVPALVRTTLVALVRTALVALVMASIPLAAIAVFPASHAFAPDQEDQHSEANRPAEGKSNHRQAHQCGPAELLQSLSQPHHNLHVNVNNINIAFVSRSQGAEKPKPCK